MAKASVREISRITGFSPATVSNALNRKRSVSEETAKVILECAQSLGYQQSTQLESIQFVLARKTGAILDESTFHPAVIARALSRSTLATWTPCARRSRA